MEKYFAYIRVSTTKQGEKGSSLQEQRASIEAFATKHGFSIVEWFEDQETAAKIGRTQFSRMMQLLRKGKARGVIVHKIDRSARNLKDWADINDLIDRGIEVHFAHDSIDMQTRSGRLIADVQAVIAADYIRNLREEVKKGIYGRLKQGLYPLRAPIGYLDNGGGKVKTIDPQYGPLIRQAFEKYAAGGHGLNSLRDEMYALGLRNRYGRKVSLDGLSTILHNTFYYGLIRIEKNGQSYEGIHEPLISKRLFDLVQQRLADRTKIRNIRHEHTFRKFVRCGSCKYFLIGETKKGRVYYRCHLKPCGPNCIREDELVAKIAENIASITLSRQEIAVFKDALVKHEAKYIQDQERNRRSVELQIAQIDDRHARLTDAYIDKLIDKDEYESRRRILLDERLHARERLDAIASGINPILQAAKEILELQISLQDKAFLENGGFFREILKIASSNRLVFRKRLEIAWLSPYDVLAMRVKSSYGGPYRFTRRTIESLFKKIEESITKHATSQKP